MNIKNKEQAKEYITKALTMNSHWFDEYKDTGIKDITEKLVHHLVDDIPLQSTKTYMKLCMFAFSNLINGIKVGESIKIKK